MHNENRQQSDKALFKLRLFSFKVKKGHRTLNHIVCRDKLYPCFTWREKTKKYLHIFQIHSWKIIPEHATVLTYMCLGCKMKDYIYFLSFKELFYKIRFTNISLNREKKSLTNHFWQKIVSFHLYQASHNKPLQKKPRIQIALPTQFWAIYQCHV